MLFAEISGMLGLRAGTVVYGITVGDNLEWQGVVVWINLLDIAPGGALVRSSAP